MEQHTRRDRSKNAASSDFKVAEARADAPPAERKRSALVGVTYAKMIHKQQLARHLNARADLTAAIVAARDEGATVAEIAAVAGVSRNAIYRLVARMKRRGA